MGILAAIHCSGCISFEDAVTIAAAMGNLHINSYRRRGGGMLSQRVYGLNNSRLRRLMDEVGAVNTGDSASHPNLYVLEHNPAAATLIQYSPQLYPLVQGVLEDEDLQSSQAAEFPSCAHTQLTVPDINTLKSVLDAQVRFRTPEYHTRLYSQAATHTRWRLRDVEDLKSELLDVSTTAMDLQRVARLLDTLSRRRQNLRIYSIGADP
jgi:hypothetical protein